MHSRKRDQAEVLRIQFIVLMVTGASCTPLLSSYLFPYLPLFFLIYSKLQRTKKIIRQKGVFMKAKKQMGWHVGRVLCLCLTHRAGVPSLSVAVCGYNFLNPKHITCFLPLHPRQPWSVLFRPSTPIRWTEGSWLG